MLEFMSPLWSPTTPTTHCDYRTECDAAVHRTKGGPQGKKRSLPLHGFPKKGVGTPCAKPWLLAVRGWPLAAVGC